MEATLQTIFLLGFTAYAASHCLPAYIRKAAWCIINCRTAVMGGHVQACPEGHFERDHYNSCRHRVCPRCAFIQVQRWLAKQKARILACDHYHVIFTIPHELNSLWPYNQKLLADILFTAAQQTIFELLTDPKYLGAKVGIIASLHTWTKTLMLHPHIHCLVTGGGLNDGKWKSLRYDYLFPIAVARILFRGKVLSAIGQALQKGRLVLPPHLSACQVTSLLKKLWKKKFNVHVQDKYSHGKGVLVYLAKYLRGGPISNGRIVGVQDGKVSFHVGREKKRLLTLPVAEFIHRFLQHIPLPSLMVVRSFGLYASSKAKELKLCHKLLGTTPVEQEQPIHWQDILQSTFSTQSSQLHDTPWQCPLCGKRLVVKAYFSSIRHHATKTHAPPA